MLQLRNESPFSATILLLPDPDGVTSIYTVIKATFSIGAVIDLADEQVPIAMEPEYYGDPAASSLKVAPDVSLMKPGTDVLLVGHAYAPDGRSTSQMDVTLSVGTVEKTVRVFGDRYWGRDVEMASRPAPFDQMPLVWERAFGGHQQVGDDYFAEIRNPVGLGFIERREAHEGEEWLPNLEDPSQLLGQRKQRPAPACFAPIAAHWEPRRTFAGTYDEQWQRERAPYLPSDFDPRFFQLAPSDLVVDDYLQGGESVVVRGAHRDGDFRFVLPEVDLEVTYTTAFDPPTQPVVLDSVLIEPDLDRVQVVWRTVLPCDKRALQVDEVRIALNALGRA